MTFISKSVTAAEFRDEMVKYIEGLIEQRRNSSWARFGNKADQTREAVRARELTQLADFLREIQFHP